LQLTLIPQPPETPRLDLSVDWTVADDGPASRALADRRRTTLRLHARGSTDLQIEWVACEQQESGSRASCCWSADELKVIDSLRDSSPPTAAPCSHSLDLPLPARFTHDSPLLVKMAARDSQGRRTVAWVTVPLPALSSERPLRLATHSTLRVGQATPSRNNPQNR
jgi:hypothetical protein